MHYMYNVSETSGSTGEEIPGTTLKEVKSNVSKINIRKAPCLDQKYEGTPFMSLKNVDRYI